MRESRLEQRLRKEVENIGGLYWKFTSPGLRGVPDRVCIFPGNRIVFVEMKAPGKKLGPLQLKRKQELGQRNAKVHVVDSVEKIKQFVEEHQKWILNHTNIKNMPSREF
ncbi:VRR-NUC domain-containing protein [Chengkuizengella sp. SCS-71B]|uniref:VRR-NUC domain-containing protein n=1 Tax=Chengkuizengella sp. SCS-71B TaxID=3115290 RepID=UPI0032C21153